MACLLILNLLSPHLNDLLAHPESPVSTPKRPSCPLYDVNIIALMPFVFQKCTKMRVVYQNLHDNYVFLTLQIILSDIRQQQLCNMYNIWISGCGF